LRGPSAVDVHHNYVQRWNEASERAGSAGRWGIGSEENLEFPNRIPAVQGNAAVQIQRTIHPGRYFNGVATPGGQPFNISSGEHSNLEQYCAAMDAAQNTIYLEHQHIDVPNIISSLSKALRRGVEVIAVVPAAGEMPEGLMGLRLFENFLMAGIAGPGSEGKRHPIWVHAKLMLIDGVWATIGSCNLHQFSLFGNSELNAAFFDPDTVRALRVRLFAEHLGCDTSHLDERTALRHFRDIAQGNRSRFDAGRQDWQGLAFSLG
jgi:phosphatidylserine/phosphatidylglycerophosphate/cardiolipin synthase-like enzyme